MSGSSRNRGVRFQPSLSAVTEGSMDTHSSRSSLSSMAESPFQSASVQESHGQVSPSSIIYHHGPAVSWQVVIGISLSFLLFKKVIIHPAN